ncbi:MAG TPA: type II toxin-antitoxin system RelE/ParE family toxin [Anaerolineales bacterium]|nr:type II toxin-antitoxin system RelE/ParE family toxin [Anaerolineales bacterium]
MLFEDMRQWRIMVLMIVVETHIFTRQVLLLLSDEEYRLLQAVLVNRPESGVIIPSSGGLRKMRWGFLGKGKRGGVRVIYYWAVRQERILMLLIYPKNVKDDLTREQLKILRNIVKEEFP